MDYESVLGSPDLGGSQEAVPGAPAATDGTEGFEIDGERYTLADLREALDARRNRDDWDANYKRRDQQFAAARDTLERAFGKRVSDLGEGDLRDLWAFGVLNEFLRANPAAAEKVEAAIREALQAGGATPQEAKTAAAQTVAAAQQPTAPTGPQPWERRMEALEGILVGQTVDALEQRVDQVVTDAVKQHGAAYPEYEDFIRESVLSRFLGYSNPELLKMARSGALAGEVANAARDVVKRIKAREDAATKARAGAVVQQKGAPPAPVRGPAGQVEKGPPLSRRGAGLRAMSDAMLDAIKAGGGG